MTTAGRTGVLGGTFDPIHCGHLDLAERAREALNLTRILFIPSRVPPHRRVSPRSSPFHRFAMVALAANDHEAFVASDVELQNDRPSYTIETLDRLLLEGYPASQLFFLTGADAFAEIATWKDYPAFLDRCHFAVVSRPGHSALDLPEKLPTLSIRMIRMPGPIGPGPSILLIDAHTADISSSEIRRRLAAEESVQGLVPPPVARHIRTNGLYTNETADQLQ